MSEALRPRELNDRLKALRHTLSIAPKYPNIYDYPKTGERRWVIRKGLPWPQNKVERGYYPYIVLPDAEVRIPEHPRPKTDMHHPELCNGNPVVAAGMLKWNGKEIIKMTNESGHYCPEIDSVNYAIQVFRFWGIPIADNLIIEQWLGCLK